MKTLSISDRKFLKAVGIAVEPTLDEDRLALAKRIAKHKAPGQPVVQIDPNDARRALVRIALEMVLTARGTDEERQQLLEMFLNVDPSQHHAACEVIYETTTGKPYRPRRRKP